MLRMIVVVGAFAGACADSQTPDPVGGETHFLHACDDTANCGLGLDCVCGVCTKPCVTDNTCKTSSTLATCESAGTPNGACVNPQTSPVCDVECSESSDCNSLGSGFTCEQGSCRKVSAGACVHEGAIYPESASFMIDCNACTCSDGTVNCDTQACPDGGMDSSFDSGTDAEVDAGEEVLVLPEPLCTNDDDAGTDGLEPSPPRAFDCTELDSVTLLPGVQVLGTAWSVGDLVLGPDDAYWSDSSGTPYLQRVPKGSDTPMSLPPSANVQGWDTTTALAVDGCRIYWGNGSDGRRVWIGSALTASGEGTTLSMVPTGNAGAVHVDGPFLYFATSGAVNELFRVGRGGGTTIKLAEGVSRFGSTLTTVQDRLYWITGDDNPRTAGDTIRVLPTDLSVPAQTFASNLANPTSLLADATHLYVATYGTEDALRNRNGDGNLTRYEIATGTPTTMATLALATDGELAQDAQYIYWFSGARGQVALMRIAKQGASVPTPVFQNMGSGRHLVVDDTHFYWAVTCGAGGTGEYVVRVPKP